MKMKLKSYYIIYLVYKIDKTYKSIVLHIEYMLYILIASIHIYFTVFFFPTLMELHIQLSICMFLFFSKILFL